jgi:TonB family protein
VSLLLALLLTAPAATPASAAPPPRAHWTSDWGDQRCSLVRETGGPASKSLMVRSVPGTEQAELWWIDPEWRGPRLAPYTRVKITLKPSGTEIEGSAVGARILGQTGFIISNVGDPFLREMGESNAIQVSAPGRTLIDLPLPAADRAVAALRACEADSLRSWGFDPAKIQSLQTPVKSVESAAAWVSDADYPDAAIHDNASGSVLARLKVGTDGRVSECVVVESSKNEALDAKTCQIFQRRGKFHPAIGADGKPTVGLTAIRIRWWIPSW